MRCECASRSFVRQTVKQEDGGRCIERASDGGDNGARVLGESIGNAERRHEDAGATERKQDVTEQETIELWDVEREAHEESASSEAYAANDGCNSWTISIKYGAHWQR